MRKLRLWILLATAAVSPLGCASKRQSLNTYDIAAITPERAAWQAIEDADRGKRYFVGLLGFSLQIPGISTRYRDQHSSIPVVTIEGMSDTSSESDARHREVQFSAVVANAIMKEFIDRDDDQEPGATLWPTANMCVPNLSP